MRQLCWLSNAVDFFFLGEVFSVFLVFTDVFNTHKKGIRKKYEIFYDVDIGSTNILIKSFFLPFLFLLSIFENTNYTIDISFSSFTTIFVCAFKFYQY